MGNFLADYTEFTSGNEANRNFHLWSALSALSAIISRRVWIDLGYFNVHTNLYVVLVSPPGNKKTTAMNIAKGLVREVGDIPFSADCQTKEQLVKEWAEYERVYKTPTDLITYTPYAIFSGELSQFLGPNSGHMIDFLTTVYDLPVYDLKTKNKGCQLILGPYISFIGCTTPDWITTYLKSDIISGGFSRRALFINEPDDGERITFPDITPEMQQAWERVVAYGKGLQTVGGQFRWDNVAKMFYHTWYQTHKIPDDPLVRGYFKTKHIQLLKVAMLLALSEGHDLVLKQTHIELGLELLGHTEKNLSAIFHGFGRNELFAVSSKILEFLSKYGKPIREAKLYDMFFREVDSREMFNILMHLEKSGKIVRAKETTAGKEIIYVMTPEVAEKEVKKA